MQFHILIKQKQFLYPFVIMNTESAGEEGEHWWSFLDFDPTKQLFLFNSFWFASFKDFTICLASYVSSLLLKMNILTILPKKILKNRYWTFLVVCYFTRKLEFVWNILWMIVGFVCSSLTVTTQKANASSP